MTEAESVSRTMRTAIPIVETLSVTHKYAARRIENRQEEHAHPTYLHAAILPPRLLRETVIHAAYIAATSTYRYRTRVLP